MVSPQSKAIQLALFILDKRCARCHQVLPCDLFRPDKRHRDGYFSYCRPCERAYRRERRPATPAGLSHRRCWSCHQVKPLEDFHREQRCVAGRSYTCKDCSRAHGRAYHAAHREDCLARIRRWQKAHSDRIKEYNDAHRAERTAAVKAFYRRHYTRIRAKLQSAKRLYYWANHERLMQRRKELYRLNPEPARHRARRAEARRRGAPGRHDLADVRLIYEAQRGRCAYCLVPLPTPCHVDHMTAIVRGGTDWPWNICLSCPRCNNRKHARDAGQYLALLIKESRHGRRASAGSSQSGLPRPRRPAMA